MHLDEAAVSLVDLRGRPQSLDSLRGVIAFEITCRTGDGDARQTRAVSHMSRVLR
jgi:hypothetical protein